MICSLTEKAECLPSLLRMFIINITNPSIICIAGCGERSLSTHITLSVYAQRTCDKQEVDVSKMSLIAPSQQLNIHNLLTAASYDCHQPCIFQYITIFDVTAL